MSKIAISGASTGSATFTIESPATSTNRTLTLPDNTGTIVTTGTTTGISASALSTGTLAAARLPAGSVLQVVQSVRTASFVTTSTSFVATGLSASITPTSATSKILIFTHTITDNGANGRTALVTIYRGATDLGGGNEGFGGASSDTGGSTRSSFDICFLDSPATTNATTYAMYTRSVNGGTIEVPPYDAAKQTITLMEIAA